MPNGGEDCCGTCPYNAKNKSIGGYHHVSDREPDFCIIRKIPIESAFYTYCANHPFRSRKQVEIAIGPVFMGESLPPRWVWRDSPDDESVRLTLLRMLAEIPTVPADEYPMGLRRWEIVIWQLGEFREPRAAPDLHRLAAKPRRGLRRLFARKPTPLVQVHALEALHKIEGHPGDDSCPQTDRFLRGKPATLADRERRQTAEAVEVAQALLEGTLGAIEASRRLARVAVLLPADLTPVVSIFGEIAATTQGYLEGPTRAQWPLTPEALAKNARERAEYEATVAARVRDACRLVVEILGRPAN